MTVSEKPASALGEVNGLDDLVDRESLNEVCRSFFDLFGISIRLFSTSGALLADVHREQAVCRYVNTLAEGRRACARTVTEVKGTRPDSGEVVHPCFTGATYRIVPVEYQGRQIGRLVIGPYLPAETREVPRSLLVIDGQVDPDRARTTLDEMPRVREETAHRLAEHLRGVLDLILFSGHRARLTSEMHVASVRESYRELSEKNVELQKAFEQLKELDRLKSNFLATVSHELRTPLTSIIGYSEMLQTGIGGSLNEEQIEFVETIRSKGEHLLALITNLLDVGKLEQGSVTLNREHIDAAALVDDVARTLTPQAQRKHVSVETTLDGELPPLWCDPVRVRQVLFNLTDNAIKFTPESGKVYLGAREVELGSADAEGFGAVLMCAPRKGLEFSIQDTGIGIPEEEQPKIFNAFYQVDSGSTRQFDGAGLGLSIVKRLVDAHDGEVDVTSEPGEGTTFFVRIPVAVPEDHG